jgi:hypothetical protein
VRGPRTTEDDIVLSIEKVSCVQGIQRHRLKAFMSLEGRAGPFPDTTHLGLTRELVAPGGDWHRVPVTETDVGVGQVKE